MIALGLLLFVMVLIVALESWRDAREERAHRRWARREDTE